MSGKRFAFFYDARDEPTIMDTRDCSSIDVGSGTYEEIVDKLNELDAENEHLRNRWDRVARVVRGEIAMDATTVADGDKE